ncbi:phage Gp19/Gp15/Gp42 family protein [Kitasatospora purpeofusca]|uniref:hypothetical protein n=1 Tax=Kitasatospora purpeofusca TaxID=67352 RepID=UPI00225A9102|nr:hypothetical protein [Kitasatospora purpeofusca]MCX4687291.1 phage Gp19/Gp15/Gp42 family protein [Kitasatospora purpeofusca]
MTYATFDDVSARRPSPLAESERARVTALVEDASALILLATGGVEPSPVPAVFKLITCRVVSRALDNPQGFSAETIGSYSYSRESVGVIGLDLTGGERAQVAQAAGYSMTASPKVGMGIDRADRHQITEVNGWGPL